MNLPDPLSWLPVPAPSPGVPTWHPVTPPPAAVSPWTPTSEGPTPAEVLAMALPEHPLMGVWAAQDRARNTVFAVARRNGIRIETTRSAA